MLFFPLFPLWLSVVTPALAQQPGSFVVAGDTLVSAMMVRIIRDCILHYTLTLFFSSHSDVCGQQGQGLHS